MIDYKHTLDIVKNTNLSSHPYSHIQCDNVFSNLVYEKILESRIETDCLQTLNELGRVGNGYSNKRKVLGLGKKLTILPENQRLFWEPFSEWLLTDFKKTIIEKFNITDNCHVDILYSRDFKGYQLGPHTDSTKKILTLLFYIPKNDELKTMGTSMYLPKQQDFKCLGNKHYDYEHFTLYKTVEYIPNRMFGFIKTDNSFHGVEPIIENIERDIIIYDIQKSN